MLANLFANLFTQTCGECRQIFVLTVKGLIDANLMPSSFTSYFQNFMSVRYDPLIQSSTLWEVCLNSWVLNDKSVY